MNEIQKEKLLKICSDLLTEADDVTKTQFETGVIGDHTYVDIYTLNKWWGKVKSFIHILGPIAKPWLDDFSSNPDLNILIFVERIKGILESIHFEIDNNHVFSVFQMLRAETLNDLYEQAETLLDNGYFLASAVLGRAVLEEHLRTLCKMMNCYPDKKRATLNDFNQSLYKVEYYTKTKMKHIETLSSIGNDAAHNKSDLNSDDVKKLIRDLPELIDSTSLQ